MITQRLNLSCAVVWGISAGLNIASGRYGFAVVAIGLATLYCYLVDRGGE